MKKMRTIIKITICLIFVTFFAEVFESCSNNSVNPINSQRSDLTRSGKFISFTSNLSGNYDIFLAQVDANGNLATTGLVYATNPFNLTGAFNNLTDKQSNWSPDGKILVFSSQDPTPPGEEDIYAFFFTSTGVLDTTITTLLSPKLLFSSNGKWDENPSFSPEGKYMIFDRRFDNNSPPGIDTADSRHILIGDVTGSGNSFTVSNIRPVTDTTTGKDEYNPKWSPRKNIRKVAYESAGSPTATDHDIWVIDPLNTSDNIDFYEPGRSGYPAWAPECTSIIFESDQGNSGYYQIVSLGYPTNSGTPAVIVPSGAQNFRYPTRLPNGNIIAFIQINSSTQNGNIYIVSSSGGTSSKLLAGAPQFDAANNLYPAW